MNQGKIVGLALGGGAGKGFAHIGVLKVLREAEIPIHLIAGTSIGALIGSLYAAGIPLPVIEQLSVSLKRKHWVDFRMKNRGLIQGQKVEEMLKLLTKDGEFKDLMIPFAAVATDLLTGQEVVFRKGNVAKAVRASIAIPGIFSPVEMDGYLLVDGGVVERVPAQLARQMGANIVIAVDLGFSDRPRIASIFDVIYQSIDIMQQKMVAHQLSFADVAICPPLGHINGFRFENVEECIALGAEATRNALPRIRELLAEKGEKIG